MMSRKGFFVFSARLSLLLQLLTVYPLILYIIRIQFFGLVFQSTWPGWKYTIGLNLCIMSITTSFAVFYPHVGDVLRFTGAIGGMILIFLVPIGIHMTVLQQKDQLSWTSMIAHLILITIGALFLIIQFI